MISLAKWFAIIAALIGIKVIIYNEYRLSKATIGKR